MTVMLTEVYDALRGIGVEDDAARRAASALATSEPRFAELAAQIARVDAGFRAELTTQITRLESNLRAELRLLKWQPGVMATAIVMTGLPALWLMLRLAVKAGVLPV